MKRQNPNTIGSNASAIEQAQMNATFHEINNDEIDLLALVRTLWNGKWKIALVTVFSVACAIYYLLEIAVPTYRATAVIALEGQQSSIVDIESVVSGVSGDQASINTEVEVLRSRVLIEGVVDKLDLRSLPEFNPTLEEQPSFSVGAALRAMGLGQEPKPPSETQILNGVIDRVIGAISVSNVRNSYVFRITAETEDPDLSLRLANATAELYIFNQVEVKFAATERATRWLTDRVGELRIELETAEQRAKNFSVETDLVSPEALAAQERQIKDLRDRIANAEMVIAESQDLRRRILSATSNEAVAEMTNDLMLKRLLEQPQSTPEMVENRLRAIVDEETQDIQRNERQVAALSASLKALEDASAEQSQDLVELRQLQREAQASQQIYEFFLARLKETSVQQGIHESDARILSLATPPRQAASPKKSMVLALSVVLGLILGSMIMLFQEFTKSAFRTPEDIERDTAYRVLGQIPLMPVKKRDKILDYLISKPTSAAMEAIRSLRTTVLMQNVDNPPKVIVSTSAMPSEGKTTTSIGLALNFASMGKRVLLIEGDMRRRVFGEYFEISGQQGLASVISGDVSFEVAVHKSERASLDVLQGEGSKINAADLYSSQKFKDLIEDLREKYDVVMIDTPPVLLVPDARIIAPLADSIVFTVKWDETPKTQVRRGIRSFEDIGRPINGIILSQVSAKKMKSYGYDSYGGYGYDNSDYYHN